MKPRNVLLAYLCLLLPTFTPPAFAQDEGYPIAPEVLACSPGVLKPGGSVTLLLGPNHGAELAILRPGGREWYFLVLGDATPEEKPLMTSQALKAARRITLTEATGSRLNDKVGGRVFSKPGRYVAYNSDKLETDGGGVRCIIDYQR
ncbi:MAG: hypothetical protein RJB58_2357 [Pseudomonadota bacterium]|jgi:hypothetical protein